jgi:DNA replication protein DnaC
MKQLLFTAIVVAQCTYAAQSVLTSKNDSTHAGNATRSSTLRHRYARKPAASQESPGLDIVVSSPVAASSTHIPLPVSSHTATSLQVIAPSPLIKIIGYRTNRYQSKKKKYKCASEYLALLQAESRKSAGPVNAQTKRLIEDAQNAVNQRRAKKLTAKSTMQDAMTALKIEQEFPVQSREYCDLLHGELLSAQEIALEYKQDIASKAHPAATTRPFDLLDLSYQSRNLIESLNLSNNLPCWPQKYIELITSDYNNAKKAFSPAAYSAEMQHEYAEAAQALAELKIHSDRMEESITFVSIEHLRGRSLEHAHMMAQQIKADYARAAEAVEKKRMAQEEALKHLNTLPQPSNATGSSSTFQSIFDASHIPGTPEYHQQLAIKLLATIKLRLRIHNEIEDQNHERYKRWLMTGDIDKTLKELNEYLIRVNNLVSRTASHVKKTKIDASKPPLYNSLFLRETNTLHNSLAYFLHPLFHGHGEPIPKNYCTKIFDAVRQFVTQAASMKLDDAYFTLKHALDDTGSSKILLTSLVGCISMVTAVQCSAPVAACTYKVLEKAAHLYPQHTPDKYRAGSSSEQTMLDIKSGKCTTVFDQWNEEKECPHGIERCPLLGTQSKGIFTALKKFTEKIKKSEQDKQRPFFMHDADVHRILSILTGAIADVYETNIKAALAKDTCDDKNLKNTRTVVETLASLPTDFYNIEAAMRANKPEIDKLLEGYPIEEKRKFYAWMRSLIKNANNPDFAYDPKNVGINLLLVGPTGVGKSHTSSELCRLLGLTIIPMTLNEVIQSCSQSVSRLLDNGELSPFEQKLAALPEDASSLLVILYVDEADNEGISQSTLKRELCQNKNLFLSALQVHLPTKRFMILSCNDATFLKNDVALGSRFFIIEHTEWIANQKIMRLLPMVKNCFEHNQLLKNMIPSVDLEEITREYVLFDPTMNMRVLISRLSCIEDYFTAQQEIESGKDYLFPDEDRNGYKPTFQEFLAGIFDTKKSAEQPTKDKSTKKSKRSMKNKRSLMHISKPSCSSSIKPDDEHLQDYCEHSSSDSPLSYTTEEESQHLSSSSSGDSMNDYDSQ